MYIPSTFLAFNTVRMLEECSSRLVFKATAFYAAAYLYLYRTLLSHNVNLHCSTSIVTTGITSNQGPRIYLIEPRGTALRYVFFGKPRKLL